MKAQELRIGNIFQGRNGDHWILTIDMLRSIVKGEADVSGIPLTEEWLIKLGFELEVINDGDRPLYVLGGAVEYFYIDFDTLQPMDAGYPIAKVKIEYVHQLQNLFYCIVGQELTIK